MAEQEAGPLRPFWVAPPLLLVVGVIGALVVLWPAGEPDPIELGHSDLGPDPFLELDPGVPPPSVEALIGEASLAAEAAPIDDGDGDVAALERRLDATTDVFSEAGEPLLRPRSVAGAAVAPGDGDEICDLSTMVERYRANDALATAFAEVLGIQPAEIGTFLGALTPGYLIDDLAVVNHRYRDGRAEPFDAVLEAGTAVLVDADGLPRVRCRCGNPLVPARVELGDRIVEASAFADRVHEARLGDDVPGETYDSVDGFFTDRPAEALGPPDRTAVSLGDDPDAGDGSCRHRILLEFTDNRLIDGPGDDLQIVELGRAESTYVSVGTSADDLRPVGEIDGGTSAIDLASVADGDERFAFVQLCDGPDGSSDVPGSDIDAVAALNSVEP